MPPFNVSILRTEIFTVTVEAEDEADAKEAACELFVQSDDPTGEFNGAIEDWFVCLVLRAPEDEE